MLAITTGLHANIFLSLCGFFCWPLFCIFSTQYNKATGTNLSIPPSTAGLGMSHEESSPHENSSTCLGEKHLGHCLVSSSLVRICVVSPLSIKLPLIAPSNWDLQSLQPANHTMVGGHVIRQECLLVRENKQYFPWKKKG